MKKYFKDTDQNMMIRIFYYSILLKKNNKFRMFNKIYNKKDFMISFIKIVKLISILHNFN
jgi:hypothetical protein